MHSDKEKRLIGKKLFEGLKFYKGSSDGIFAQADIYGILKMIGFAEGNIVTFKNYAEMHSINGRTQTIFDHVISGSLVQQPQPDIAYPLKFSFDKNASYDDCQASESYEKQGYYYE